MEIIDFSIVFMMMFFFAWGLRDDHDKLKNRINELEKKIDELLKKK